MILEIKEHGRNDPTFEDASFIAQQIQGTGYEFESGTIKFNQWVFRKKNNRRIKVFNLKDLKVLKNFIFNAEITIFGVKSEWCYIINV